MYTAARESSAAICGQPSRPSKSPDACMIRPHLVEVAALRFARPAGRDDRQPALLERRSELAPARVRPSLVTEHRRGVDHGVALIRPGLRSRARGADQFRNPLDAERICEPQYLLDPMQPMDHRHASMQHSALDRSTQPRLHRRQMGSSGRQCEQSRPVTALRRNRERISFPEPRHQGGAFADRWPPRHGDDGVEVGIALEDPGGGRKHQRVDGGIRPCPPQAADQRRGEQDIAEAPQRYDQNARSGRKLDRSIRRGGGELQDELQLQTGKPRARYHGSERKPARQCGDLTPPDGIADSETALQGIAFSQQAGSR